MTVIAVASSLVLTTGCGSNLSKEQQQSQQQSVPGTSGQSANRLKSEQSNGGVQQLGSGGATKIQGTGGATNVQGAGGSQITVPVVDVNGTAYVVGTEFAKSLGYDFDWDAERGVFQLGDHDAAYEFTAGSPQAEKEDQKVSMNEPVLLHNSQVHLPVASLTSLMQDEVSIQKQGKNVVISVSDQNVTGSIDGPDEANTGAELDFEDDPNDPFKGVEGEASPTMGALEADGVSTSMNEEAIPVLKNVNVPGLIAQAKRYLGVKYDFGARPYPQSGRFDCSTFTQYIFGKYGVSLNRTARAQARQGTAVSRKSLRKGDLMFFYVPGRFKTNRTVGHVSIYMGNQLMIHASPKPKDGVQITRINKPYWKQTFLTARRFVY
ncbi:C40 family peptidase [Paenibacillus caseinilyticus]|nr:C40 family peptidase [Paenibacillus caseinilyticus]MCZ8518413.1 NlpC/P60 family protein [Paenibacillus caseinilyticus]